MIPDDAVDLGGRQGLGGGESRLPLSCDGLRGESRGGERTESKGKSGESHSYTGDSTGKKAQEFSVSCGVRRQGLLTRRGR